MSKVVDKEKSTVLYILLIATVATVFTVFQDYRDFGMMSFSV